MGDEIHVAKTKIESVNWNPWNIWIFNTIQATAMNLSATKLLDILQSFMLWVLSSKLSDICIGVDKMCKFEHWKTGLSIISDTEFQMIAKMFYFYFFKVGIAGWFPIFSFIIRTWNIRYIDLMLLICRTLTTKVNLCRTKAAISAVSQYNQKHIRYAM